MTACIYYHPDGYTTAGRQIKGRHAAGESFLRGFLQDSAGEDLWILVEDRSHLPPFEAMARGLGRLEPIHVVDRSCLMELAHPGLAFHPGPGLGQEAWRRNLFGHHRWSLCGVTHTICSSGAMEAIVELTTAPLQPWDALICTSEAVRLGVERLLEGQLAYLRERLGCTRFPLPQLPVIPLGVHCDDFRIVDGERPEARSALGCGDDTQVVLFLGRLSFHAKAHPLVLYQALQRAAAETGQDVVLLECGWHANAAIRQAYEQAASRICPDVRVVTLDGGDAAQRRLAWAAADVFCSLSDNIQETFGITPLEAMAAGLPVVVSDWDGYRDTVRDGIDGYRIPTLMPPPGLGGDLAVRHALGIDSYDVYYGYSCALVSVQSDATTEAFRRLFESPELRRRLGEAGRERVRRQFDWTAILLRSASCGRSWPRGGRPAMRRRPDIPPGRRGWIRS
jgi:starch synthase